MTTTRFAWWITIICGVFAIADTLAIAASRSLLSEETIAVHGWPFVIIAGFSCAAIGALIVSRHPRHPVGWLLCAIGVGSSTSVLAEAVSIWILEGGGPGSADLGHVLAWFSVLLGGQASLVGVAVIFLLAPDGHFLSRRWRAVAWVGVGSLVVFTAGLFTVPPREFHLAGNPYEGVGAWLTSIGFLLMIVVVVASVGSMIVRLRRAEGELARQLRLFVAAAASVAIGLAWLVTVQQFNGGEQTWIASLPLFVAYVLLSVGIGMAVLRYRLYDLDVIINRGVVLACGTIFAAVAYTVLVVAVSSAASSAVTSIWLSVAATVVVALAFQPLRKRVVRLADRVAYGTRAAPYEALAQFSQRLSGTLPGTTSLLPTVADAAVEAVSAQSATVRLLVPDADDLTARRPVGDRDQPTPSETTDFPVVHRGEALGVIRVEMPPGRLLRARDHQLLVDLADQTSMAFRNRRLTAELVARVDMVDRRAGELAQSRGRLIDARDAERARLEHALRRDVLPHLERVPAELERLREQQGGRLDDPASVRAVDGLVDATRAALEALREISRGVFPTQLARAGLAPAIAALIGRVAPTGTLTVDPSARGRRFDQRVETRAYACAVEVLPELESPVAVRLAVGSEGLVLELSGDATPGSPELRAVRDRVESLDGTVTATAASGRVTVVVAIPLAAAVPADGDTSADRRRSSLPRQPVAPKGESLP